MQSLQVLDNSLSYQNPEPIDGATTISGQWTSPFLPFDTSMVQENPNETFSSISKDFCLNPQPTKYMNPPRQTEHRTCENYSAYPLPYSFSSSFHASISNFNSTFPVQNQQIYPPMSSNDHSQFSLTEVVENGRHCPSDSNGLMNCTNSNLNVPEFYSKNNDTMELGQMGTYGSCSRQKPEEEHNRRWNTKSEFLSHLDTESDVNVQECERESTIVEKSSNDHLTLSSFREALGIVDPKNTSSSSTEVSFRSNCHFPVLPPEAVGTMGLGLTSSKQEEVLKAAKSLFSKRTRTLYQWLCPEASKTKLKASVTAAWDTLSEPEKHFYISQVLGRFGLQESSLMVNPQLDGIKGLPVENIKHSMRQSICKARAVIEDQQAVNALFESCDDSHNWTSFRRQKKTRVPRKKSPQEKEKEKRKKRKYTRRNPTKRSKVYEGSVENNENVAKCLSSCVIENVELNTEAEKYKFAGEEEFWNNPLNPEELFPEISF